MPCTTQSTAPGTHRAAAARSAATRRRGGLHAACSHPSPCPAARALGPSSTRAGPTSMGGGSSGVRLRWGDHQHRGLGPTRREGRVCEVRPGKGGVGRAPGEERGPLGEAYHQDAPTMPKKFSQPGKSAEMVTTNRLDPMAGGAKRARAALGASASMHPPPICTATTPPTVLSADSDTKVARNEGQGAAHSTKFSSGTPK